MNKEAMQWALEGAAMATAMAICIVIAIVLFGCDRTPPPPVTPEVPHDLGELVETVSRFDQIPEAAQALMVDAWNAAKSSENTMTVLQAAVVLSQSGYAQPVGPLPDSQQWGEYRITVSATATALPVYVLVAGAQINWCGWHEGDAPSLVEEMVTFWADGDTTRSIGASIYAE